MIRLIGVVLGLMSICIGCSGARKPAEYISEPSGITIEQAMEQVTNGFQKMVARRMEGEKEGVYQQLGLHAAEVTISFNVTGSSTSEGKLFVDLAVASAPPPFGAVQAGMKSSTVESAMRGNQICIRFVNLLFAPNDVLVSRLDGHDLHRLRYAVHGHDPGARGASVMVAENSGSEGSTSPNASQSASRTRAPGRLPDLPPISAAARDEGGADDLKLEETAAFRDLLRQLERSQNNLTPSTTQPATQPAMK